MTNRPTDGHSPSLQTTYRSAVLRGVAAAQFLRRASGSNAGDKDTE